MEAGIVTMFKRRLDRNLNEQNIEGYGSNSGVGLEWTGMMCTMDVLAEGFVSLIYNSMSV